MGYTIKKIGVFCASRISTAEIPHYTELVRDLATELTKRSLTFIYGGGTSGLMGELAKGVVAQGGQVYGYLPRMLREESSEEYGHLIHVPDFSVRLQLFEENSDAFIAFPGGLGTLSELIHILSSIAIGMYKKPIAIVNDQGFYDGLIDWIHRIKAMGFLYLDPDAFLIVETKIQPLMERLLAWTPPPPSIPSSLALSCLEKEITLPNGPDDK